MIRQFISRLFRKKEVRPSGKPVALRAGRYDLHRGAISPGSRRVVETLQQHGFQAYIVGGAVRDLLAGLTPKDFDVATDATPEQVRQCFRRSRIVGRRFQIAHVMMGAETVEVTTFRGHHGQGPGKAHESTPGLARAQTDAQGRVLRDNVFGSQAEDAARRDFTINALYYDPASETIVDFHHGVDDLEHKTLRMIGEPKMRYREDPVRMLRAVRLAAKLDFTIEPTTRAPIGELADLLSNVPPARLFDEILKLLTCGQAVQCLTRLREEGLHHGLLPLLDVVLEQPRGQRFVMRALGNTDRRVREGKGISPGFLFAALLWNETLAHWETIKAAGERPIPALFQAMDEVLDAQAEKLALTRRVASDIKDIWALQPRFEQRSGKRPYRVLENPRFRAGYDFLLLRAEAGELGEAGDELVRWWMDFMNADGESRAALLRPEPAGAKKRRRRRSSKNTPEGTEEAPESVSGDNRPKDAAAPLSVVAE